MAASAPLAAVELIDDVRFIAGRAPEYSVQGIPEDVHNGRRFGIDYATTFDYSDDWCSWLLGAELSDTRANTPEAAKIAQQAFTAFSGVAIQSERLAWLHAELTPCVGIGWSRLSTPTGVNSDLYYEYGIRGGLFATAWQSLQLGIDARYVLGEAGDESSGDKRENEGLIAVLVIGVRL
jgi:hypothetical protein